MADEDTLLRNPAAAPRALLIPPSDLDHLLTAQLAIAWAGERGESPRLGWWDSDLTGELGGQDLLQRLLPETWAWATLQSARAAAMRRDAALRREHHDPDGILSLFHQGFHLDELADARLLELKHAGVDPQDALPGLRDVVHDEPWERARFLDWLAGFDTPETEATPIGRRIRGACPEGLDRRVRQLLGALSPLGDHYPMPHHRGPA